MAIYSAQTLWSIRRFALKSAPQPVRTLALPLEQRRALAGQLRETSQQASQKKTAGITDVNEVEVDRVMRIYGVHRLIHGHTHRPAIHNWSLDGQPAQRMVLGDWYRQGSVLYRDAAGWRLESLFESGAVQQ